MKKRLSVYLVDGDTVQEIKAFKSIQQGRAVWRTDTGTILPEHKVRFWRSLTTAQKICACRLRYDAALRDIDWSIAKDPSLAQMRTKWEAAARAEYEAAISEINQPAGR